MLAGLRGVCAHPSEWGCFSCAKCALVKHAKQCPACPAPAICAQISCDELLAYVLQFEEGGGGRPDDPGGKH